MIAKSPLTIGIAGALLLALLAPAGRSETLVLANGDQLTGDRIREDAEFIELQHAQLGLVRVPRKALRDTSPAVSKTSDSSGMELPVTEQVNSALKPELMKWKRQMEVGYAQQSGAKEKQDLSIRLQFDGKEGANTFRGTARMLQSEVGGVTVTERQEADFRWRYDINKRLFAQALTNYAEDIVRKVDLSLEQQLGGGYRLVDSKRHKANIGLGAVVQYLERVNANDQTALLGSVFQDYAYQWNSQVKLVQDSSFMFSDSGALNVKGGVSNAPAAGSYRMKFNTGIQSKVTSNMSLNVRFEYDYDNSIEDSRLRVDQRLTTSLGYIW